MRSWTFLQHVKFEDFDDRLEGGKMRKVARMIVLKAEPILCTVLDLIFLADSAEFIMPRRSLLNYITVYL